ncbi:MAG TPA: helix-turn-helix domain-containing protein, partial [Labilithrix sp.]|nr:helix-turn-helix domain-containing protein [Labilithrix sp.]
LADLAPTSGRRVDDFADDALEAIRRYSWPGNVRELRNAIEHAIVLGSDRFITAADLPEPLATLSLPVSPAAGSAGSMIVQLPASLEHLERLAIDAALKVTGGNRTKAAALLGINRATLYNKMRREESGG